MNNHPHLTLTVNGQNIDVPDEGLTLLDVLRDHCGTISVKDGCSPQGQCGCCTVLVDGQARVSCVTPARRVAGRKITTLEGLDEETQIAWGSALCSTGGSQCGFCTPGIIMRFADLKNRERIDKEKAERALHAHLCRCTGWQTILEAWDTYEDN
ncbi:MAG TPA: 2Fe-2S iron-sulfur cluster-binding protein, partial [Candidatus Thalassarchaeaceae archaeon]|nr:2Fe-2S iron-sulfur cluster-binding protein [Candidatus Thalassarchaeaceae archaeon]